MNPDFRSGGASAIPFRGNRYNAVVTPTKALCGFLLLGFLHALPGVLLPAWGYHRDPPEFVMAGTFFLGIAVGVAASMRLAGGILGRGGMAFALAFGPGLACISLLGLAMAAPPVSGWWRTAGLTTMGLAGGLLASGLFHALQVTYVHAPAATVAKGGILYGLGCLAATLMVGLGFYAYSRPAMFILVAAVPAFFAGWYARTPVSGVPLNDKPTLREASRDLRHVGTVLFALLIFFQFGNEWSLAGWLPLFLVRRIGLSPKTAIGVLAVYWSALLAGRVAAVWALPRVRHRRLLLASVSAALLGCAILFFTNNVFGASSGVLLAGGGFAAVYPLVAENIGRRFHHFHPGLFHGIFSFAIIGGMLAPATIGYAAAIWDVGVAMAVPLLGTCMVFVLTLLIWLDAKVSGA